VTEPDAPLVRVVVVTYQNADLVDRCLDALAATDWPADRLEVVVVDNASTDGTPERVSARPGVRLVRSSRNLGFGGGCNLGLRDLGGARYAALVNSDLFVTPGWLRPLVDALEGDRRLGAACPKVVLEPRFAEVVLDSPTFRPGGGDPRTLGLRVTGVEVAGRDVWDRAVFARGWSWDEGHARWTTGRAELWVPAGPDDEEVAVHVDGEAAARLLPLGAERFDVVNNAGNVLTADGFGADRGWLERDRGQFDAEEDVFAWYGGCCLLSAAYLHDVGLFDEPLFLYYEDLDLAWRGRERGWRYRYVPTAVVRHRHRASTGGDEGLFDHLNHRNRLVVLTRHAGPRRALGAWSRYLWHEVGGNARGEILQPVLRGRRPHPHHTVRRLRAAAGAARLLARSGRPGRPGTPAARR